MTYYVGDRLLDDPVGGKADLGRDRAGLTSLVAVGVIGLGAGRREV